MKIRNGHDSGKFQCGKALCFVCFPQGCTVTHAAPNSCIHATFWAFADSSNTALLPTHTREQPDSCMNTTNSYRPGISILTGILHFTAVNKAKYEPGMCTLFNTRFGR